MSEKATHTETEDLLRQIQDLQAQNADLQENCRILEHERAETTTPAPAASTPNDLELELQKQTELVAALKQELQAFAYSVSHDLRAPLRRVEGFAEILFEDHADQLDDEAGLILRRITNSVHHMGELIEYYLHLSKITSRDIRNIKLNLGDIAESILAKFKEAEPERVAEFKIDPDLNILGDPGLIENLLQNLLDNAWKFTSRNDVTHIKLAKLSPEQALEFDHEDQTVYFLEDNGVGFEMKYKEKLFNAFQRLHAINDFKGSGVGLCTVRRILNRRGGTIWAESAVDEGSTFYFTL